MKIYLAADHRGFKLKGEIFSYLVKRDYDVVDCGNKTYQPDDDFPFFAQSACLQLLGDADDESRAILLCGGGQGMAMAANRFEGVRAVVVRDRAETVLSRKDNNANVLALPADVMEVDAELWQSIVDAFLQAEYAGLARYERRNKMIDELEGA
ncbi:MAG: RpiB/LacA/LacB family sugar-phosphate isomerase [Candidatus Nomurabacteria bacterium]|jgi:ribose 5-phosphate isomerase B|nr:RpiB/LacA/LacB family sugar-phosphate isomerase [Candidatus Nomurabacteria bacterium]